MFVSSANKYKFEISLIFGRSLMYIKKAMAPELSPEEPHSYLPIVLMIYHRERYILLMLNQVGFKPI